MLGTRRQWTRPLRCVRPPTRLLSLSSSPCNRSLVPARRVVIKLGHSKASTVATQAVKAKGRLDVLVNNAGVAGTGGLSYSDHAEFAHILSTNFDGLVRTTEKFLPLLSENGRIVNISSASGPMFLAKCTPERVKFFIDPTTTLEQLRSVVAEASAISSKHAPGEVPAAMAAVGLGEGAP